MVFDGRSVPSTPRAYCEFSVTGETMRPEARFIRITTRGEYDEDTAGWLVQQVEHALGEGATALIASRARARATQAARTRIPAERPAEAAP